MQHGRPATPTAHTAQHFDGSWIHLGGCNGFLWRGAGWKWPFVHEAPTTTLFNILQYNRPAWFADDGDPLTTPILFVIVPI